MGTRKYCKHFQKGRAKMDQSEHIIRDGSFNTRQSYMVTEAASTETCTSQSNRNLLELTHKDHHHSLYAY